MRELRHDEISGGKEGRKSDAKRHQKPGRTYASAPKVPPPPALRRKSRAHFNYQYTNDGGIIQKFEEYLSIFGIDKNGEINDGIIKKAYRKKMKEVHPDKNTGNTTEQAQKINEINEFLKEQLEYYLMKRGERK